MKYVISLLLLTVFCWQPVVAQSDIELTDSTSTEWGENVGGGFFPNMPYYEIVYILDGIEYKRESIVKGNVVNAPKAPVKEGHTFSGWTGVPATMPAKDVTVTGIYTINKYTLTYTVDGTVYKTSELEYGATVTAEAVPIKEGHTFSGWSEIPATMPAKDVTVTGTFTANSYKVTYILGGETFKTEQVVYGTAIPTPEVPAKEGYNFSGWGEIPATMPARDLTFTGSYTINKDLKYNLVYIVDGTEYKRVTIAFGDAITLETAPTKEGHTFSGWSEVPETMPLHDVTVTGTFTANSYTLTYVLDGATFKTETVTYGTAISTPEVPAKEGHTFAGWTNVPATMPAKDITVTGTFTANSYKVTYILDGETFKTETVTYGTAIPTPEVPAKEGYNFSGWGEVPATMPAKDLTFTGSYIINKDLKYNLVYMVDGTEYKRVTIDFGDAIILETAPTKEGHTFSGWSEVPETMPLHDVTVTGTFTANSYTLTYVLDGETFKTETVTYGTAISTPEVPAKEGHTFAGWTGVPATMPAKDVTMTGTYTINKYTLTYMVDGTVYKMSELEYGAIITAEAAPIKEGHTFSGWSEIPVTMPAKDVTVTGTFTANSYKVTYILDGETFKTETVTYGTAIPTPEVPAKEGYNFSGWGEVPATMPAKDLTFTGSYTINKDLKYNLVYMVDGTEYKRVTIAFGDAITLEAAPTKEGHTFSGWSEVPETMPLHDVTITGAFTVNIYTVVYKVDGEVYATEEVAYGETVVLKEEPVKEGYLFSGWSEISETMPAKDIEVTGHFEVDGIDAVLTDRLVDVYTLQGVMLKRQISIDELRNELSRGIYIINGKKIIMK